MVIECTKCGTKFRFPDDRIKPGGIKVRCGKCSFSFRVEPAPDGDSTKVATPEEISEALRRRDTGSIARAKLTVMHGNSQPPTTKPVAPPAPLQPAPEKKEFQVPAAAGEDHHVVPTPSASPYQSLFNEQAPDMEPSRPRQPQAEPPVQSKPKASPLADGLNLDSIFEGIFEKKDGDTPPSEASSKTPAPSINLFATDISSDLESLDELQHKPAAAQPPAQDERWAEMGRELIEQGPSRAKSPSSAMESASPRVTMALEFPVSEPVIKTPTVQAAVPQPRPPAGENPFSAPFAVGIGNELDVVPDSSVQVPAAPIPDEFGLSLDIPGRQDPATSQDVRTSVVQPAINRRTLALFGEQADELMTAEKLSQDHQYPYPAPEIPKAVPAPPEGAHDTGISRDFSAQMESMGPPSDDVFARGADQLSASGGDGQNHEIIDADNMPIEPIIDSSGSDASMAGMLTEPADFSDLLGSRKEPELRRDPVKTSPKRPPQSPVQAVTPARAPEIRKRGVVSYILPWVFTSLLLVGVVALLIVHPAGSTSPAAASKSYRIQGFKVYETKNGRKVGVITGEVKPEAGKRAEDLRIRFTLNDYAGNSAVDEYFTPAKSLTPIEIRELTSPEQASTLLKTKQPKGANAGGWSPFQAIFFDPPDDLERFIPDILVTASR
jgi:predicted Zn finger-like uncharacterized protein